MFLTDTGLKQEAYYSGIYEYIAEIWCFTLSVTCCTEKKGFEFPYCYGGRHISEYCDAIKECAEKYNCRVFDLYGKSVIYDTLDGFHPNAKGMKQLADAVIEELKRDDLCS